jgi:hypothetical protein
MMCEEIMVISEPHCSPCKILEVGVFVDARVRSIAKTPRLHARHEIPVTVRASEFVGNQRCCDFGERSMELVEILATMKSRDDLGHEEPRGFQ